MARKPKAPEPEDEPLDDDSGDDAIDTDPVASADNAVDDATETSVESDVEDGSSEAVATEQPAPFSLRDAAVKAGLRELEGAANDEEAARGIFAYVDQLRRQQQQYQYQFQQLEQQRQQWQRQQPAQAQPAVTEKPKREVPEYDPNWLHMVKKDAEGNLVSLPGARPDLPEKIIAYANWRDAEQQKLLADPVGYVWPMIQDQVAQLVEERTRGSMSQAQEAAFINQTVQDNADWIYEHDATGNVVVDPFTGSRQFSPYGQRYFYYAQQADQFGIKNPWAQDYYAKRSVAYDLQSSIQQSNAAANASNGVNGQLKQTALKNGAARTPNRGGSIPRNPRAPAQNGRLSIEEMLRSDLEANGFDHTYRLT